MICFFEIVNICGNCGRGSFIRTEIGMNDVFLNRAKTRVARGDLRVIM